MKPSGATPVRTGWPSGGGTSCASPHPPPLHGGGRGGLGMGALLGVPSPGAGAVGVGARRGLSFLSTGAHDQSRRFSALVTSFVGSCPNGVARDRRGTAWRPHTRRLCPAGAAAASAGQCFPSPCGPWWWSHAWTAVSLTWGSRSFPGALCAAHPHPPAPHPAGWPGPAAGLPRGRPARAERPPGGAAGRRGHFF